MAKHPCGCCGKPVKKKQKALLCTNCSLWVHISCGRVPKHHYDDANESFINWECPKCLFCHLPFESEESLNLDTEDNGVNTLPDEIDENLSLSDSHVSEFPNNKGIKVAHLNVRSMRNKAVELQQYLLSNPYDVLCLSETWLDEHLSDNMVSVNGYKFERKDRGSNGGGVGCYIKDKYTYVRRFDLESDEIELMWLEIKQVNTKSLFVGVTYRKPSQHNSFFDILEGEIERVMSISNNVILLGDFNCNMLTENVLSRKLNELCISLQMRQIIEQPTRTNPYSSTLIDLILTSNTEVIVQSGVQPIGFSDHSLVYLVMKGNCRLLKPKISKIRSFRAFDADNFKKDLSEVDWEKIFSEDVHVNEHWNIFKEIFTNLSDKHAPFISVRRKRQGAPWITNESITLARDRDYHKKKFHSTKLQYHWDKFKFFRNKVNNLNKSLKQAYYKKEFSECGNDIKKNWKILKDILPSKKKAMDMKLVIDDDIITDNVQIADTLNEAFNNISNQLNNGSVPDAANINAMNTLPENKTEFKFKDISLEFVKKELDTINCKKAIGIDGLHPKLLQMAADYIAAPLTYMFNRSLKSSQIPQDFKRARITPIHKGGTFEISNFRPISILPILSKILEKAVHIQLYDYLNNHNLLSQQQSGFRPLHSTATSVTHIVDFLLENMNSGKLTGGIFLDLKKAFDVIPLNLILAKLKYYGIRNNEYEWFMSYLLGRKHCVSVQGYTSDYLTVQSGVPQGSILGPLIFCLFINDICMLNLHSNTVLSLYADDTAIFNNDYTLSKVQVNLQSDFDLVVRWLEINCMYIHPGKTKVIAFGPKCKLRNKTLCVKYNNVGLEQVHYIKYLGIIIDSQLLWSKHIESICSKVSRSIGCIRRIRHLISYEVLINLYYALILPYLNYCCTAWGGCSKTNISKLQKLQNKYARLVLNADRFTSKCFLLTTLNWLSVEQIIKYQYCILTYKALNNLAPTYIQSMFKIRSFYYCTRYSLDSPLTVPHPRTDFKKRSFSYIGSSLFNKLSNSVQTSSSLNLFKSKCKSVIHSL